ncbi:hypothetical protein [Aphanothece minutissima]|uniref:hypothetical protein n=1 Tax=Aphanothece minutissima TaxID=543815 RepID=UPI0011B2693C|nr:hypothetical protein [Aphanothece minutissima]
MSDAMQRTIVDKGIAGLGNRLQVLGHCCDLSRRFNAVLCVDWTHNSWNDLFEHYFSLACPSEPAFQRSDGDFGHVIPPRYASCITQDPLKCEGLPHGTFLTDQEPALDGPWDTLVVCRYLARYSNRLFRLLRLHQEVRKAVVDRMSDLGLSPGSYDCWHVRHTDASGGCPLDILKAIAHYPGTRTKVVITDSVDVIDLCVSYGVICPSIIPVVKSGSRHGVHHLGEAQLGQQGLVKQDVNRSAVVDLMIAGLARQFWGTCQRSTFSEFIYRGRIVSWFDAAVFGQRLSLLCWANTGVASLLFRCYLSYKIRWGRRLGWIVE